MAPRQFSDAAVPAFAGVFTGYVNAPVNGIYTFNLTGNDAAALYIDGTKSASS